MASDKKCEVCKKTFSTTYNLKKHLENIHKQQVEFRSSVSQKCPLCTEMAGKKLEDLQTHIKEVHDIQMEEENINFENLEYFIQWKQNEEKESKAMFIKKRMTVERKDVKCTTYYCNRSGFFKSNSNGQRHIKVLGSNKINASCPARMKIKVFLNGRVELNYVKTHIGHTMDLARMRITEDERKLIANKLANNIPISDILDGVKTRADKMDKERIDLLKRRDVINIATCYNLKSKEIFANGKRRKKVDLSPRIECGELETGANECVVTMQEQEIASNFLAEDDCDDVIIFPDYAFTKLNNVNIGNTRIKRNSKSTKKSTANRRKMAEPTLEEQTEDLIIENYIVIETVES